MRLFSLPVLSLGFLSACSASHDLDPGVDAAIAVAPDGGTPPSDAAVIADAWTAPPDAATDAAIDVDGGSFVGDPSCAPDGGPPPRFRDLYESVIAANGCASECHGGSGSTWSISLDMRDAETAYRSLVNVESFCDERVRVVPCHPEQSTLSVVPSQREEPCGRRHTFVEGRVTEDEAAQIDDWIRMGAAW